MVLGFYRSQKASKIAELQAFKVWSNFGTFASFFILDIITHLVWNAVYVKYSYNSEESGAVLEPEGDYHVRVSVQCVRVSAIYQCQFLV